MIHRATHLFLLLASLFLTTPAAATVTTGDNLAGYFFLPTPPLGFTLMSLPASAPPGTVRRVVNLGAVPDLIAAHDGRLVMLYKPTGPATNRPRAWLARQVRTTQPSELVTSDPLPPLITDGTPVDLAATPRGALALVAKNEHHELVELAGDNWHPTALPDGFDPRRPAQLFAFADRPAIFQNTTESTATLWQSNPASPAPHWTALAMPAVHDAELQAIANQLIALQHNPAGEQSILLIRPTGITTIAALSDLKPDHWIVPAASTITVIESDGNLLPRLSCRVISPTGAVLYNGWAQSSSTLGQRDFALLALALASLFSAVLIFVFRPESSRRESIILPKNTALAGPATRALAGVIDALAAWLVAGLGCGIFNSDIAASLLPSGNDSSATLLIALPIAVLTAAIFEFTLGKSLGKSITGCRVVTTAGTPITIAQALSRNLVRFLCPPLGMAWMIQTPDRAQGLFGTIVVIDLPD